MYFSRKQEISQSVCHCPLPHISSWYLPALHVVFVPRSKPRIGTTFFLLDSRPLKMGPIGCAEMSVRNHRYSLRNSPEERSSLLNTCINTVIGSTRPFFPPREQILSSLSTKLSPCLRLPQPHIYVRPDTHGTVHSFSSGYDNSFPVLIFNYTINVIKSFKLPVNICLFPIY
jgi:hypothetical protein